MDRLLNDFMGGTQYYDYPSFQVAIFSLLLALVLSTTIAFTYKLTLGRSHLSNGFFQAIVLSSLVTSMIMMAVGDNLAVGFGIIGAVAIIRFRTNIQNPRNIIFIFVALSVGIATGVYGYAVAIAGTGIFCITAFLLYWSPYGTAVSYEYEIIIQTNESHTIEACKQYLNDHALSYEELDLRSRTELDDKYEFKAVFPEKFQMREAFNSLNSLEGISNVRISKRQINEQL